MAKIKKENKMNNYKPKKITKRRNAIDNNYFFEEAEGRILDDIIQLEQEFKNKRNDIRNEHNYSLKIS